MVFKIYHSSDYQAIYADGEKLMEGHIISAYDLLRFCEHLNVGYINLDPVTYLNDDYMEKLGWDFPETIEEIDKALGNITYD